MVIAGKRHHQRRVSSARRLSDTSISLAKQIPSGGGLGGGSSDAARTLLGLAKLWQLDWSIAQLSTIAELLGSDVPFFLYGPSSVCTGRGEVVQPIAAPACKACVLILPGIAVPTPAVYRRFDELRSGDEITDWLTQPSWHEWAKLSAIDLLPKLANDLEPPAFDLHPELRLLHQQAQELLGQQVRMSGSGSGLFSLYDTLAEAERAATSLRGRLHIDSIAITLAPTVDDDLADEV